MDLKLTEQFLLKMVDFADFAGVVDLDKHIHVEKDLEFIAEPLYGEDVLKVLSWVVHTVV